jgi:hypothetical protein
LKKAQSQTQWAGNVETAFKRCIALDSSEYFESRNSLLCINLNPAKMIIFFNSVPTYIRRHVSVLVLCHGAMHSIKSGAGDTQITKLTTFFIILIYFDPFQDVRAFSAKCVIC